MKEGGSHAKGIHLAPALNHVSHELGIRGNLAHLAFFIKTLGCYASGNGAGDLRLFGRLLILQLSLGRGKR